MLNAPPRCRSPFLACTLHLLAPSLTQGYANPAQYAAGIHIRLYARAFIAADAATPSRRFVFVNMDAGMASQAVTFTVVARLRQLYGELYSEQNVALSGTHTHSGPAGGVLRGGVSPPLLFLLLLTLHRNPCNLDRRASASQAADPGCHLLLSSRCTAGYLQYVVYGITSLGFYPLTFDAIVEGVVLRWGARGDARLCWVRLLVQRCRSGAPALVFGRFWHVSE